MYREVNLEKDAAFQEEGDLKNNLLFVTKCFEDDMIIKLKSELLARKQLGKSLEKVYEEMKSFYDLPFQHQNSSMLNSKGLTTTPDIEASSHSATVETDDASTQRCPPSQLLQHDSHQTGTASEARVEEDRQAESSFQEEGVSTSHEATQTTSVPSSQSVAEENTSNSSEADGGSHMCDQTTESTLKDSMSGRSEGENVGNVAGSTSHDDSTTPAIPDNQEETNEIVLALSSLFERINGNGDQISRIDGAEVVHLLRQLMSTREEQEQARVILSGLQNAHRVTKKRKNSLPEGTKTLKETFGSFEIEFEALDLLQDRKKWSKAKLFMCRDLDLVFMLDKRVAPARPSEVLLQGSEHMDKETVEQVEGQEAAHDPSAENSQAREDGGAQRLIVTRKRKLAVDSEGSESGQEKTKLPTGTLSCCKLGEQEKQFMIDAEIYVNEEEEMLSPKQVQFMEQWWSERHDYRSKDIEVGKLLCVLFEEREDDLEENAKKRKKGRYLLVSRKYQRMYQET